ncbi:MAG: signal peptidase I [Patescibacteria group bacterium]
MEPKNQDVTPVLPLQALHPEQGATPQPPSPSPLAPPVTKKKHSGLRGFLSTFILIGGALLFAIFINQFIFQSYEVDGSSMEPSLQHKDRLIIWKLPRTWARITKNDYSPARGDVVVFHKPDGSEEQLIKRVIGLPGDRVVVSDGTITVFNKSDPDGFQPDDAPYGKNLPETAGNVDVSVGEGEIFVSGDNRIPGASLDSRSSLGNIDLGLVVGKLVLRLFPFQSFETF